MKKIVGFLCAITIISVITIKAYREYDGLKVSDVVLANVDALADEEYTPQKYCILHIKCFDSEGRVNGCRANSYMGDVCTHRTFHTHDCSGCCSI